MTELARPSSSLAPSAKSAYRCQFSTNHADPALWPSSTRPSPRCTCLCSHPSTLYRVIKCRFLPSTKVKDTSCPSSTVHVGTKFHALCRFQTTTTFTNRTISTTTTTLSYPTRDTECQKQSQSQFFC